MRGKRGQRSSMGNKIWLLMHPRNLGVWAVTNLSVCLSVLNPRTYMQIHSGAPRAREARAERSNMGKKIW